MTFGEIFTNCIYYQVIMAPVNIFITFARFICATILHLSLIDEIGHGLLMMKFACNHSYKFKLFGVAWLCGFLQTVSCLCVEVANIGVLCGANDTIDVVFNFIALAIITDFDNLVFSSMKGEAFRELIIEDFCSEVLKISHTTSKKCSVFDKSDQVNLEGEVIPLRVQFKERSCCNKFVFIIYKMLRTFYVSLFFYFMPFCAIVLSTLFPLLSVEALANAEVCPGLQ